MTHQVEFFYDFRSPCSYLAFTQLLQMNVTIAFKPMQILKVMERVGNVPWQRARQPDKPDDYFISPKSIAAEVFHLAHQPRDAWSFLAEVRPFHEVW